MTREDTAASESFAQRKDGGSLWGGRFEEGLAPEMVPFNLSLGIDSVPLAHQRVSNALMTRFSHVTSPRRDRIVGTPYLYPHDLQSLDRDRQRIGNSSYLPHAPERW